MLLRILGFIKAHNMPETSFGRKALNDPRLISDLRNGRELGLVSKVKIIAFMDAYERSSDV